MSFKPPGWFFSLGGSYLTLGTPAAFQGLRGNSDATAFEWVTLYSRSETDATFAKLSGGNTFTDGGTQLLKDGDGKNAFGLNADTHIQSWYSLAGAVTASVDGTTGTALFTSLSTTPLPAANLTGSIADARLSSNVPLKNAANTFTTNQTISGNLNVGTSETGHTLNLGGNARIFNANGVYYVGAAGANTFAFGSFNSSNLYYGVGGAAQVSLAEPAGLRFQLGNFFAASLLSDVGDGSNAVAFWVGTNKTLSNANAKLQSWRNNGTEQAYILANGTLVSAALSLGGATVTDILSATATLDFAATDPSDLTITVTGAALGDTVAIGVRHASVGSNNVFYGWVSAADTVTIRKTGSADPASGTFRATVIRI